MRALPKTILAIALSGIFAGCGTSAATPTATTHMSTSAAASALTRFGGQDGVLISSVADANRLIASTPADFRTYIGELGAQINTAAIKDCGVKRDGVYVLAYMSNGWAFANGDDCAGLGAETLLSNRDGHWRTVMASQDVWNCAELAENHVPRQLVGVLNFGIDKAHNCWNSQTNKPSNY